MAWYAYCITEQEAFLGEARARRPFPIENVKGVNGSPVYGYPSGDFAVIVSEYERTGDLDQRAVLDHARVVSSCFGKTTVLPFNSSLSSSSFPADQHPTHHAGPEDDGQSPA